LEVWPAAFKASCADRQPQLLRQKSLSFTVEHNVAAKMRDGVTLRADIYRPKANGKFPVLLERTPYDKSGGRDFGVRGAATRGM